MAVHKRNDIVSNAIRDGGKWDESKSSELLRELRNSDKSTFFDVGANVGWFSLLAAYSGFQAVTVEPFESNINLFKMSLCMAPPDVRSRITLLPVALGEQDGTTCSLYAKPTNQGDTHTMCQNAAGRTFAKSLLPNSYLKLGQVRMYKLDSLIKQGILSFPAGDKVVMKIDGTALYLAIFSSLALLTCST